MKAGSLVGWLAIPLFLSGCVSLQLGGDMVRGRRELLYGDPKVALTHFQRAADLDPDYRYNFSILEPGVWTYVGRAHYAAARFPEARQALERARSRYGDDNLAKLYLGLVLARDGDRQGGLREMETGLKGLEDWFEHLERYHPDARFWDPGRHIRTEIRRELAMIAGKEINFQELVSGGEWLGKELEQEMDRAVEQRKFEENRDGDKKEP